MTLLQHKRYYDAVAWYDRNYVQFKEERYLQSYSELCMKTNWLDYTAVSFHHAGSFTIDH